MNIFTESTCCASYEDAVKSEETCKIAVNQSRSLWSRTAADILQEQSFKRTVYSHGQQQLSPHLIFFSCRKHVYAGEIGVILTLGSRLIAAATVSKNTSPRLRARTDADRRGCWENAAHLLICVEMSEIHL